MGHLLAEGPLRRAGHLSAELSGLVFRGYKSSPTACRSPAQPLRRLRLAHHRRRPEPAGVCHEFYVREKLVNLLPMEATE